jgi:hypothetical protein
MPFAVRGTGEAQQKTGDRRRSFFLQTGLL